MISSMNFWVFTSLLLLVTILSGCAATDSLFAPKASKLLQAAAAGDSETAKGLLDNGADVNSVFRGDTPLIAAARKAKLSTCRLLLDRGAGPNLKTSTTPLMAVLQNQSWNIGEKRYQEERDRNEIARLMLQKGANPNDSGDSDQQLPLESAVYYHYDLDTLELLLNKGANPNAFKKAPPLVAQFEISNADTDLLNPTRLLLKFGADPNTIKDGTDAATIVKAQSELLSALSGAGMRPLGPTSKESAAAATAAALAERLANVGNVELSPRSATLARLKELFGTPRRANRHTENGVDYEWFDGVVDATFFAPSGEADDSAIPIDLMASVPFKGTICGVRIGDQLSKANGWRNHQVTPEYYNKSCGGTYSARAQTDAGTGKVISIGFSNSKYLVY